MSMTAASGVLALIGEAALRDDVDRVAAAAGVPVVHAHEPSSRKVWSSAAAVVLDVGAAARCAEAVLPRRARVVLVCAAEPGAAEWQAALSVGAQHVVCLPGQGEMLVAELAESADAVRAERARGPVIAVIGARGGAGASLFATALALCAREALLIDTDPWGGGLDLVAGTENEPGLRWPDLSLQGGRLHLAAVRDALPRRRGVSVLSSGRSGADIAAGPVGAVIDAGCRGGATVVCDVPRRTGSASETALVSADLVVLLTPADVRSCAAATAMKGWLAAVNPNLGVVVRGPAPGGLTAREVVRSVGLPLLATMRAQPALADGLERAGLVLRQRSPLARAARTVLAVLADQPAAVAA
jgi:secretion/DNA translocation related CpaE-like protein